ncbi:hypothetical protein [Actinomadura rubrisoli]|uniref:DUF4351 domain-containing protein n=1 Tax=Actinomadura rubrisoli TaxID=2530368 RepID=A0A4R5AZI2_9ACTN|nr:hypothetical protein [Actinomadura rubrisoli]TDD77629.1 hypothetical protein E1298_29915 [Actinomadura rubrisoli]
MLDHYQWQSEFAITHRAEGRLKGRVKGSATAILLVLDARGVAVPDNVRERVTSCTDLDQLERLIRRAAVIESGEELFG